MPEDEVKYWENDRISLGLMMPNEKREVTFKGNETLPEIKRVDAYCGCTYATFDNPAKTVTIHFTAPPTPYHLIGKGPQFAERHVNVIFMDEKASLLRIDATIK